MSNEQQNFNKVARITLYFWLMKVLATTLGEVLGEFFSMTLTLGYVISLGITVALFLLVLFVQLNAARFQPVLYWLVIIGTTTVGTEISDLMDRTFGLGYALGSLILFSGLSLTLLLWQRNEGAIRVYPVTDGGVEVFYWIAILFSNSLGTAFGDYLSDTIGLSYLTGAFVTGGIIGVVVLLHYYTTLSRIFLFWVAFIFTRPFGATFGDFLTKPLTKGGLNIGRGLAALITAGLLFAVMFYATRNRKDEALETQ